MTTVKGFFCIKNAAQELCDKWWHVYADPFQKIGAIHDFAKNLTCHPKCLIRDAVTFSTPCLNMSV